MEEEDVDEFTGPSSRRHVLVSQSFTTQTHSCSGRRLLRPVTSSSSSWGSPRRSQVGCVIPPACFGSPPGGSDQMSIVIRRLNSLTFTCSLNSCQVSKLLNQWPGVNSYCQVNSLCLLQSLGWPFVKTCNNTGGEDWNKRLN